MIIRVDSLSSQKTIVDDPYPSSTITGSSLRPNMDIGKIMIRINKRIINKLSKVEEL